ncbi:MAG: deoxyguanosinetriphosphate triphosphohydrolase [Fimbriimonadaceae bacterium]|nr:deoxyguanosinetriphosphate triphosphohydrolase [Fimbriimonadaceae bacterium]QYK55396.1 MAG: deoxyguanosinetriphosphate triphosphohydrolase [Fimbriimonadaceae bacterium]
MADIRDEIEAKEAEFLGPFGQQAAASQGRERPEPPDPVRTAFMVDRDRVLHSKPFRRLKHKTQVFVAPAGDHFRTRLTHTLEVAQIARTVSRALRLNEDLTEAIALAHDLGHTPFGHAGEEALHTALLQAGHTEGFRHSAQSLRVVEVLTPLNLTWETRQGIAGHSKGAADLTDLDGEPTSTLEAAVVRVSDRIAYLAHDLDDAVRSGIVQTVPKSLAALGETHGERVGRLVGDVIEHSRESPAVRFSPPVLTLANELKTWLFENVYLRYTDLDPDIVKAQNVVRALFDHYQKPDTLPPGFDGVQGAVDYVSGMTDRFAIADFQRLFVPTGLSQRLDRLA